METSTQAKACPVAELVHRIVPAGEPHLTLVRLAESVNKVVACAVELTTEEPLLGTESSELILVTILNYDECRLVAAQFLNESVHRNPMVTQTIQKHPFHVPIHVHVLREI